MVMAGWEQDLESFLRTQKQLENQKRRDLEKNVAMEIAAVMPPSVRPILPAGTTRSVRASASSGAR